MTSRSTDEALQGLLQEGRARAATSPGQGALWEALAAATEGGKRFRPALVTGAHDALGGRCPAAAVEVGAAVELLHTALVIHDDVIDGDDLRRGRLNVSGTFRAQALSAGATPAHADDLARTAGILAGDLALAASIRAVATCGAPPQVVARLLDLFDAALHTTATGELTDVRLSLGIEQASLSQSLAMEEQKTGVYSFSLPLQAGALLAEVQQGTVDRLGAVGRMLGVAFQLTDDLLGVFGDPARTGKSATSDLRTCKQTPLLAHARTTPEWAQIVTFLGRDLSDEELDEARRLLSTSGSRRFVEELAGSRLSSALVLAESLGLSADLLGSLVVTATPVPGGQEVAA